MEETPKTASLERAPDETVETYTERIGAALAEAVKAHKANLDTLHAESAQEPTSADARAESRRQVWQLEYALHNPSERTPSS